MAIDRVDLDRGDSRRSRRYLAPHLFFSGEEGGSWTYPTDVALRYIKLRRFRHRMTTSALRVEVGSRRLRQRSLLATLIRIMGVGNVAARPAPLRRWDYDGGMGKLIDPLIAAVSRALLAPVLLTGSIGPISVLSKDGGRRRRAMRVLSLHLSHDSG